MATLRYSKGNWSKTELRKLKKKICARHGAGPRVQEAARIEFMDAETADARQRRTIREQYDMPMPTKEIP